MDTDRSSRSYPVIDIIVLRRQRGFSPCNNVQGGWVGNVVAA